MKSKPENTETAHVVGYLGGDNVLYCSPACAAQRGQPDAAAVDDDQYQLLMDRGSVKAGAVCPVCGSDYPIDWPDDK